MLTEKKKLPPMLARLKKKGKLKLKKEDILKYSLLFLLLLYY